VLRALSVDTYPATPVGVATNGIVAEGTSGTVNLPPPSTLALTRKSAWMLAAARQRSLLVLGAHRCGEGAFPGL